MPGNGEVGGGDAHVEEGVVVGGSLNTVERAGDNHKPLAWLLMMRLRTVLKPVVMAVQATMQWVIITGDHL